MFSSSQYNLTHFVFPRKFSFTPQRKKIGGVKKYFFENPLRGFPVRWREKRCQSVLESHSLAGTFHCSPKPFLHSRLAVKTHSLHYTEPYFSKAANSRVGTNYAFLILVNTSFSKGKVVTSHFFSYEYIFMFYVLFLSETHTYSLTCSPTNNQDKYF